MSTLASARPGEQWPAPVLAFADQQRVRAYLDPLREALEQLFPTRSQFRVLLEEDPEIRDDRHLVFEVRLPAADVPDYRAAMRAWHRELFRFCPAPLVCVFRLALVPVPA